MLLFSNLLAVEVYYFICGAAMLEHNSVSTPFKKWFTALLLTCGVGLSPTEPGLIRLRSGVLSKTS